MMPEIAFGKSPSDQWCAGRGRLPDEQVPKLSDHMNACVNPADSSREGLAHDGWELQDFRAPRQSKNVHGIVGVRGGDNRHRGAQFTHREGDVGIDHVIPRGDDHHRPMSLGGRVGVRPVDFAEENPESQVMQTKGLFKFANDHDIGITILVEALDERCRNRVVAGENDVAAC